MSNWGRWGVDDELGTLNLITPDKRLEAVATVREGISVGCARPIVFEGAVADAPRQPQHFMISSGESAGALGAVDFLGLVPHGSTVTHVDALCHVFWGGRIYNDRPAAVVTSALGATVCSVEPMRDGVITRGVLLDIPAQKRKAYLDPGEPILPDDLEQAERAAGLRVGSGDALLIRTGWSKRREDHGPGAAAGPYPGLHISTLPWLRDRDIAVLASDAVNDAAATGGGRGGIHVVGIVSMGLCLLDGCQFEDVAAHCSRSQRWEFLFLLAPIRFRYATGSPVTPITLF